MVCNGAQLEIGWLPLVQQQSGTQKIHADSRATSRRRAPCAHREAATVDRSQGDVHPEAIRTSISIRANVALVAAALGERMARLDAADAALKRSRTKAFLDRWDEAAAPGKRRARRSRRRTGGHHKT
jgi:zinc/manganese transport system substrate-binding protein